MSALLLSSELNNLISEAKRKNTDLRNAAEKSSQELKSLSVTSEQQLAGDLSRRPAFVEPFLIACSTRNVKFAASGVTCLQRLVISKGLPRARLKEVLEAFNACTALNLEIQLKLLQALPALLQNYADDLTGDLLSGALQVCSALQSVKPPAVSGVAAATLQQLLSTVFDKVTDEDRRHGDVIAAHEVSIDSGPILVRSAAYDAYRIFLDLVLATDGRKGTFVDLSAVSQASGLELIGSCIQTYYKVFANHDELINVVNTHVFDMLSRILRERLAFRLMVRAMRVVDLLLRKHLERCADASEMSLGLLTRMLEPDAGSPWKRVMVMEVLRGLFGESGYILRAFSIFDAQEGRKAVVQDIVAAFVRLSTEKPALIGLGQQSTVPTGPLTQRDAGAEQVGLEAAGGVASVISSALAAVEVSIPGISAQWSNVRVQFLDQLDKAEAPSIPDTYIYSLVLECLNSLSESLARLVLPLTVQHEDGKARKPQLHAGEDGDAQGTADGSVEANGSFNSTRLARSESFRTRTVPTNPLSLEDSPMILRVRTCAGLIDACWPALLATCSTFLYAALDNEYYRTLIKSYQRFAQVAGLLRLSTPRDAFMTTLGKAAVPAQVLNASLSSKLGSPGIDSPRVFSSPKSMLSVDSLINQTSGMSSEKSGRASYEPSKPALTTRNLLCLRALLNLAIALGPTLEASFSVVVETLKQADMILSAIGPSQTFQDSRPGPPGTPKVGVESPAVVQAFSGEVAAVEAAASRLLESTADYPNEAFIHVLRTFCGLLHSKPSESGSQSPGVEVSPPSTPHLHMRRLSSLPGISTKTLTQAQDFQFVLPKIGNLADLNLARFANYEPETSGWTLIIEELTTICADGSTFKEARRLAIEILGRLAIGTITILDEDAKSQRFVQQRVLSMQLDVVRRLYAQTGNLTTTDLDVHAVVLQTLRSILEQCGESLSAGWDTTILIANSVFEDEQEITPMDNNVDDQPKSWRVEPSQPISTRLSRLSFAIVQLICSDFLDTVPPTCIGRLIELLYRFMSQNEDLNISLTTITLIWNLSDFLYGDALVNEVEDLIRRGASPFSDKGIQIMSGDSPAAQWLLVLVRLRDIVTDERAEVRNAALQTACSIFRSHGDQLMPATWDLTLRRIILRMLMDDVRKRQALSNETTSLKEEQALNNTSKMALENTAGLIASYLSALEQMPGQSDTWETLISTLESYVHLSRHVINSAAYSALASILSCVNEDSKQWQPAVSRAASMWARRLPTEMASDDAEETNQPAFESYTSAASEIYRLAKTDFGITQIDSFARNLLQCIRQSDRQGYESDITSMTTLQTKVMNILNTINTETTGVVPVLVKVAAELASLPFEEPPLSRVDNKPTFVAISRASMSWLKSLITAHASDADLYESGGMLSVLRSLGVPMDLKYGWKTNGRSPAPWHKATSTALSILEPVLKQMDTMQLDRSFADALWTTIIDMASAIMAADCSAVPKDTNLVADEDFDVASLESMKTLVIPRLGSRNLSDELRQSFTRSLFRSSIIHMPEPSEVPDPPLKKIYVIRRGSVQDLQPSPREDLAYKCLDELLALTSVSDGSSERKRLAQAAAPLLVLRLALPIKSYIADQPLRGRMSQRISELEELLYCLKQASDLRCEPEAFAGLSEVKDRVGEVAHLQLLYPLFNKALGVAGDRICGDKEVLTALRQVLEVAGRAS